MLSRGKYNSGSLSMSLCLFKSDFCFLYHFGNDSLVMTVLNLGLKHYSNLRHDSSFKWMVRNGY